MSKILLALVPVVLIGLLLVYRSAYKKKIKEAEAVQHVLDETTSELKTVTLKNGEIRQEKEALVVESEKAKETLKTYYEDELNDLKENHDVKVKNLHTYYKGILQTKNEGKVLVRDTTIIKDSTIYKYPVVNIWDGYLKFNGQFKDSSYLDYQYYTTDSLSVAFSTQKIGIWPFRKEQITSSFYSTNPNSTLKSSTAIYIPDKKKVRINFRPYVGGGVTYVDGSFKLGPQAGLGFQIDI